MNRITLEIEPVAIYPHFDKVAFRAKKGWTKKDERLITANVHEGKADMRKGHPIRGSDLDWLLTVTAPNEIAKKAIVDNGGYVPNSVEVTLDIIVETDRQREYLQQFFTEHFTQSHHGKRDGVDFGHGSYSRLRSVRNFKWYCDKNSKVAQPLHAKHCFHFEAMHQGMAACRKIGIKTADDLIGFDHLAYWQQYLKLMGVDLERLGRGHSNRIRKERRQTPKITQHASLTYNEDRRVGGMLFRILGAKNHNHTVQRLIDRTGRGPHLYEIDASPITMKIAAQKA